MDWASGQNPDFMSFLDHNIDWDLLMDSTLFGDNSMVELLAAAGSHNSLMPNFPDTEEGMGHGNDISSLQFDFNQFLPTSNTFQYEAIDPTFELVDAKERRKKSDQAGEVPYMWIRPCAEKRFGSSHGIESPKRG
ncbi:hypothetical protein A0O28_0059520 [Trichoderma guizhouense]|uniref:Uncharacterized protein n=1 Tax=Trichoderma guizhouense TaxID=1491466 RepID=A0A1T3C712_9HYPO|nr:hypothetical protein A0O28_0059520 [Trichoderma guizhouense]